MHQATVAARNQTAMIGMAHRNPKPGAQTSTPTRNTRLAKPAMAR
jgi:hypothetical protein